MGRRRGACGSGAGHVPLSDHVPLSAQRGGGRLPLSDHPRGRGWSESLRTWRDNSASPPCPTWRPLRCSTGAWRRRAPLSHHPIGRTTSPPCPIWGPLPRATGAWRVGISGRRRVGVSAVCCHFRRAADGCSWSDGSSGFLRGRGRGRGSCAAGDTCWDARGCPPACQRVNSEPSTLNPAPPTLNLKP